MVRKYGYKYEIQLNILIKLLFSEESEGKPNKWFKEKWANLKEAHVPGKILEKICEFLCYI